MTEIDLTGRPAGSDFRAPCTTCNRPIRRGEHVVPYGTRRDGHHLWHHATCRQATHARYLADRARMRADLAEYGATLADVTSRRELTALLIERAKLSPGLVWRAVARIEAQRVAGEIVRARQAAA